MSRSFENLCTYESLYISFVYNDIEKQLSMDVVKLLKTFQIKALQPIS